MIAALDGGAHGLQQLALLELYLLNRRNTVALSCESKNKIRALLSTLDVQLHRMGLSYNAHERAWRSCVICLPWLCSVQIYCIDNFGIFWLAPFTILLLACWHCFEVSCIATLSGRITIQDKRKELKRLRIAATRDELPLALALFGWDALRGTEVDEFARQQVSRGSEKEISASGSCGNSCGGCGGD